MKKMLVTVLLATVFTGLSTAAVQHNVSDTIQPGEAENFIVEFDHDKGSDNPLLVELEASSVSMDGEEFDRSNAPMRVYFDAANGTKFSWGCEALDVSSDTVKYSCRSSSAVIPADSTGNKFDLNFTAAVNIEPARYNFSLEAGPAPSSKGQVKKNTTVPPGKKSVEVSVSKNNIKTSVDVKAQQNSKVFVETMDTDDFEKPSSSSQSVGGVSVTTTDNNTGGNVTFKHSKNNPDDYNFDIYYWNSTSGKWTDENIVSEDFNDTHVWAEVSHFSTYAAFTEQDSNDDGGTTQDTDSGGGGSPFTATSNEDENQTENETGVNQLPIAEFSITYSEPNIRSDVFFNASESYDPDGEIVAYDWSFGTSGVSVTESFSETGSVDVTLNVTDDEGATRSITRSLAEPEVEKERNETEIDQPETPENSRLAGRFFESTTNLTLAILAILMVAIAYLRYTNRLENLYNF